jgi:DNA invertase Pin-like site-specific DNA recombinase
MPKAIVFSRVSTKEQAEEGYSLQAQAKLLQEYADKKQMEVVQRYIIPESARGQQERKLFNAMLRDLRTSNAKILLCEKVDRITRNFKDAVLLNEWLEEDDERQIHFVKQNLVIHQHSKSNEKFQWDIHLVLARQYSNNLSEEAIKGLDEKAAQGWYPGSQKRGYKTIGETGRKQWVLDDVESPFIRRMFQLYDTGEHTLLSLSQQLYSEGWKAADGKPLGKTTLHGLLTDCFYCGEFKWNKKHFPVAKHEPLISKAVFYRTQEKLTRKVNGKYRKTDMLFRDFTCGECGRSIVGEVQKGYHYYHCTRFNTDCTQRKYIRQERYEEQILAILASLRCPNKRMADWVRKALKASHTQEKEHHGAILENLREQETKLYKRLDDLYEDKADEKITSEFYDRKFHQYQKQLSDVQERQKTLKQDKFSYLELGSAIFELAQTSQEIYQTRCSNAERRELLNLLFSNVKVKDGKLLPDYKNGIHLVAERAKNNDWLDGRVYNPILRGCLGLVQGLDLRGVRQAGHLHKMRQMRQYNRGVSRRTNYLLNIAILVVPDA